MNPRHARSYSRGFSLVELMVSITIGLLLMVAISEIFVSSKQSHTAQGQLARMQESARYAYEVLMRDTREAGFLGGIDPNSGVTLDRGVQPLDKVISGAVAVGACSAASWAKMINQRVYALDATNNDGSTSGNYTDASCIPDARYAGGDVLIVRRVAAPELTAAALTSTGVYMITDAASAQIFTGTVAPVIKTNSPLYIYPIIARAYYLDKSAAAETICPNGVSTTKLYSLYRLDAAGALINREKVISGVEDFQVQVGLDIDGDGTVDDFIDPSSAALNAVDSSGFIAYEKVIAIRIWFRLRSACFEAGYTNTNTYTYANQNFTPPASEKDRGYRRLLFNTTIYLRNPPRKALI